MMFHNVLAPSPLYQNMFRHGSVVPHPGVTPTSASFLVENLLRDRNPGLLSRPVPTAQGLPVTASPLLHRGHVDHIPVTSVQNQGTANSFLKFGVNAILGTENSVQTSE